MFNRITRNCTDSDNLSILIDPKNQAAQAYGITGVPETYIIDKQGVLREKFLGPRPWDSPGGRNLLMQYIKQ